MRWRRKKKWSIYSITRTFLSYESYQNFISAWIVPVVVVVVVAPVVTAMMAMVTMMVVVVTVVPTSGPVMMTMMSVVMPRMMMVVNWWVTMARRTSDVVYGRYIEVFDICIICRLKLFTASWHLRRHRILLNALDSQEDDFCLV